jgi:two-component system chemotaxis response regulator CheY
MKAIVVDDAKAMRMVVSNWLKECGFDVSAAENGREAWASLNASGALDCAVVDCNMPVMTGHELVIKLRASPKFKSMKILMVSSETGEEQRQGALASGANDFLAKPLTKESLSEALRGLGLDVR